MSKVTDELGLTGRQRTSLERAWVEWRRVLGLDQAAIETFRRFMVENSSMVVDGIPPGFRMDTAVEIAVGSPMLAPMFWRNRSWVTVPDADFDRVRAAWGEPHRGGYLEIIDPTRILKRSRTTGAYEVAVLIQVFMREGLGIEPEEAHRAWSGFWNVLGIGEEHRGVMTDFLLENSSRLVDSLLLDDPSASQGVLPPSLDDGDYGRRTGTVAEIFRRAAWRQTKGDPGLTIDPFAPVTRIPGAYDDLNRAEVQAWRRIDL